VADPGRRPLLSGNWKMHHTHFEAIQMVQKLALRLTAADHRVLDVSVHPPFTDVRSIQTVLDVDEIPISLGAQDCHWEDSGAFTGEVSPLMLAKLNVSYVIVGHSERRQLFGETDESVALKLRAVLRHGMTPIVCVGETLTEREAGAAEPKVTGQLRAALEGLEAAKVGELVVAYEPIWAIGTGHTASPEDAQEMTSLIRATVSDLSGGQAASRIRIQYGGSVKASNIAALMAKADVDGALVGGASLDADTFSQVVKRAAGTATGPD
jgi:triosephosphate isomerase (TIM)